MEFLFEYLAFAAKFFTVFLTFAVLIVVALALAFSKREPERSEVEVRNINDRLRNTKLTMQSALLSAKDLKKLKKAADKANKENTDGERKRVFVCQFVGDVRASAVESLRDEITAILTVARPEDEVVVAVESGGGTIHGYGLAASQLARIKGQKILLTVTIDKVAASGGYMMACVADRIVAAPFAIVGSIGVVAQMPNFNRLLKKFDIDFEQMTAGEYKRTLSLFGENSQAGREKFQEELEEAHDLFKTFVKTHRPKVEIEEVAKGEHWFGTRAKNLNLIDDIATSDDYLVGLANEADVFAVSVARQRNLLERLMDALQGRINDGISL
ncbi:MAG: protease SohB [Pseudomonadota bacterium]